MKLKYKMDIKKIHTPWLALVALAFVASTGLAQTTAFVGATIETADKAGRLENATLVFDGDKIVDVGVDVKVPSDARVISMNGKTIMPGVVDPYFVFSSGSNGGGETRTIVVQGRTFVVPARPSTTAATGFNKISEYFYPFETNFMPAVRTGITSANLVAAGQGLSAFANVSDDRTPEMLFQAEGLVFATITNSTSSLDILRKPLTAGSKSSTSSSTRSSGSSTSSRSGSTSSPSDSKKYWDEVVAGKKPVFANLNTSAAVAYVLQIAKTNEKVKFVLVATGPNLYPLIDELKEVKNVTVVLQPGIDTVPYSTNLMNVSRLLEENKIPFAISMSLSRSQMNSSQDDPFFPVASLVRTGLTRNTAINSLTLKPAELMGIDKTHGSLAKDKHANFLIFDGDPLETGSRLEQVYLNGNMIHEN